MVHLSTSALNHIVGQETIPPATIGLAAEKTPPPLPQGGGTIWLGGGVWGSLLIYTVYIMIHPPFHGFRPGDFQLSHPTGGALAVPVRSRSLWVRCPGRRCAFRLRCYGGMTGDLKPNGCFYPFQGEKNVYFKIDWYVLAKFWLGILEAPQPPLNHGFKNAVWQWRKKSRGSVQSSNNLKTS